jgi:hypothetical protein
LRVEFKSKAIVHFDQHKAPTASASLADNGAVHTVAINALTDVVRTHPPLAPSFKGNKYALPAHMQVWGHAMQSGRVGLKRSEAKFLHKPQDVQLIGIRRGDAEKSADIIQKIPCVKLIWAQ